MAGSLPSAVSPRGYCAAVLEQQILDLAVRQRPPMPAQQIAEPKIPNSNAYKSFNAVSEGLEHPPDLPVYSLSQDNADTRRRERTKLRNSRTLAIQHDSTQELWSKRRIPRSIQRDLVFLVDLETGVGELLCQFAIISQEQQAFSLRIEASDIEESRKFFRQEIKHRVARVKIFSSADEATGFIQHNRKRRSGLHKFAIDFDVVACRWLDTEVGAGFAVDCDAARRDQLIAMPA